MLVMVRSRYLVDTRTEAVQKQFSRGVLLERCFRKFSKSHWKTLVLESLF